MLFLTTTNGATPLHFAAISGHVNVSRLLVERGGKRLLAAKTKTGLMAEHFASLNGHEALAGILLRARVANSGLDVTPWGQARAFVSPEVESLAVVAVVALAVWYLIRRRHRRRRHRI